MSCSELFVAQKALTTIGTTVRVAMAPPSGPMPTYTVTAAIPTAFTITAAATAQGAKVLALTTPSPIPLPAGVTLTFTSGAVTVRQYTKAGVTAVPINPVASAIAAAETATYTPDANGIGDSLLFVSPTPTFIDAGDILAFGSNKVVVTAGQPAGAQLFPCVPLTAAVTSGTTALTQGLLLLAGANDATPSSSPKTSDRTRYLSGSGAETQVVGANRTVSIAYMLMDDPDYPDLGAEVIERVLYDDLYTSRQIYAYIRRANGETYEGMCVPTQGSSQAPVQEKITVTVAMQFQGCTFKRTAADANDLSQPQFAGVLS